MSKQFLEQYLKNPITLYIHTTMSVLTFYQTTLFTACLITLIRYLHFQHYACIDVFSDVD